MQNGLYTLKRNYRYTNHASDCIFYDHDQCYNEEENIYGPSIFHAINEQAQTNSKKWSKIEENRRVFYKQFCMDILSETLSFSFNKKNRQSQDMKTGMEMFSCSEYLNNLNYLIKNTKLSNGKNPYEVLEADHTLSFGLIYQDIDKLDDNELELHEFKYGKLKKIKSHINDSILSAAQKRVKNKKNILPAPYMYIAIYENNGNNKVLKRLFIYGVAILNNVFSFVESKKESYYAKQLISKGSIFLKPINGKEYKSISNNRFPNGRPDIKFVPDFMIFHPDGTIEVIEVCGYPKDEKYMADLERKEHHYHSLEKKGLIKYTRITI